MAAKLDEMMLHRVYQWYREKGPVDLPEPELDGNEPKSAFYGIFEGHRGTVTCNKTSNAAGLEIDGDAVPLIAGALAGFNTETLARIADTYNPNVSQFFKDFWLRSGDFDLGDGPADMTKVFMQCFSALEMVSEDAILQFYNHCSDKYLSYIVAMTHAESPALWPSSLISQYHAASMGPYSPPPREFSTQLHSISCSLKSIFNIPHDEFGPRFDLFLERSGMMLPAVTGKLIGEFTLWEDLLHLATTAEKDSVVDRLFNYCIDNPPEHLRRGIGEGFRSICADSSTEFSHAGHIFVHLAEKLPGTWLEPVLSSPSLMLNCIGSADPERIFERTPGAKEAFAPLFKDIETLAQRVYDEFMSRPTPAFQDIDAIRHLERVTEESKFRPNFSREQYITHLLKCIHRFPGSTDRSMKEVQDVKDQVYDLFKRALNLVHNGKPYDYSGFSGLKSHEVRILVEEGFEMRKLPRMNHRDRGRIVENDLGM